jgi:hypothetical protein
MKGKEAKAAKRKKGRAIRTAKMIQLRGKTIYLECPKHHIPYQMESSRDPLNEGAWKYYYCEKCREERAAGSVGSIPRCQDALRQDFLNA